MIERDGERTRERVKEGEANSEKAVKRQSTVHNSTPGVAVTSFSFSMQERVGEAPAP